MAAAASFSNRVYGMGLWNCKLIAAHWGLHSIHSAETCAPDFSANTSSFSQGEQMLAEVSHPVDAGPRETASTTAPRVAGVLCRRNEHHNTLVAKLGAHCTKYRGFPFKRAQQRRTSHFEILGKHRNIWSLVAHRRACSCSSGTSLRLSELEPSASQSGLARSSLAVELSSICGLCGLRPSAVSATQHSYRVRQGPNSILGVSTAGAG